MLSLFVLQPQKQRRVDHHEHRAEVVPQGAGDRIENAERAQQHCREVDEQRSKEHLERLFEGALSEKSSEIPREYLLNHMVCDFAETVRWWMRNDNYSPEEVSRFFLATTLLR